MRVGDGTNWSEPVAVGRTVLPTWPLLAMFGLVPLWWVLGAFYLIWPVFGALLLVLLMARGGIALPAASVWWLLFLALVVLSGTRLGQATDFAAFLLRLAFYGTAFLVCVYVYTALREQTTWSRVFTPLCLFWLALVALGWLGVVLPRLSTVTPVEVLLPRGLAAVPFVNDLVHLQASEFNARSAQPTFRPAAPFPYTNNWGSAYALLVPCVVGYLTSVRTGPLRIVLLASLPVSLPPAFYTLNRGMFVSLGAGLAFLGLRSALRGNVRIAASVVALGVLGWLTTLVIPVLDLIAQRVDRSGTTADRTSLYLETLRLSARSPLLGFGGPLPVDTTTAGAPVGTQGQLWLVLFSHGVPALLCFLGWLLAVLRRGLRVRSPAGQWLSLVPLVALVQVPFYGLTYHNLSVVFFAAGLLIAATDGPVRRWPHGRAIDPAAGRTAIPGAESGRVLVPSRRLP